MKTLSIRPPSQYWKSAFLSLASIFAMTTANAGEPYYPSPVIQHHEVTYPDYRFQNGEALPQLKISYSTLGTPHQGPSGEIDNAVLVLHWTGNSGASVLTPEYVSSLYAKGKPLDARKYFLIVPDNIGHGQSSKPSDGLHAKFPQYGYEDMIDIQHKLITETLGIHKLRAILGMSMGGMNAWQWATKYPNDVQAIMPVVSFPTAVSGRNLLWRKIVTQSIRNDPTWKKGEYSEPPVSLVESFQLLRMMIDSVPHLQTSAPSPKKADEWLETVAAQGLSGDANDLLYSLESSRDYNPEPDLGKIKAKVFALNFSDDEFNPNQLQILQRSMKKVRQGRYVVQAGSDASPGHLTMAHPSMWADQVKLFMQYSNK